MNIERNTPLPPNGGREGFESNFWDLYPRREDEQLARKAWAQLAPDVNLQRQIAGRVRLWAQSDAWRREDGRFIPKPHRWLERKRWTDVPPNERLVDSEDEAQRTKAMLDAREDTAAPVPQSVRDKLRELRSKAVA